MSEISGKDILQDLVNAKHDDVVFLNPPVDSKKGNLDEELQLV